MYDVQNKWDIWFACAWSCLPDIEEAEYVTATSIACWAMWTEEFLKIYIYQGKSNAAKMLWQQSDNFNSKEYILPADVIGLKVTFTPFWFNSHGEIEVKMWWMPRLIQTWLLGSQVLRIWVELSEFDES